MKKMISTHSKGFNTSKKYYFLNKNLIGLLFLLLTMALMGQTVTIGNGTSTQRQPIGSFWGHERSASIYLSTEMGGLSGYLNSIAWYAETAGISKPIKIYLKDTTLTDFSAGSTWASQISGATLVLDSTITPVVGWNTINIPPAFFYSGTNNLLVLVETNYGGTGGEGSLGNNVRYSSSTNRHQHWSQDNSPPTGNGTRNSSRPNIQLSFVPTTPCAGTPVGGTVAVNPTTGAPGSSYTVSATGFSVGTGLTYQWQFRVNSGAWTNQGAASATYSNYTATAPAVVGDVVEWRLSITCTNSGLSSTSSTANFTTVLVYCNPVSNNTFDYISGFTTSGGVTNVSNSPTGHSTGGYGDYYNTHSVSQYPGGTVNFVETYTGGSHGFSIWIDFNSNGIFETTERVYNATATLSGHTGNFTIPAGVSAGDYRMRIRAWWNNLNPDPCSPINWGEAEDYKLTVIPLTPCTGTPEGGVISLSPASGTPGTAYTVSATGHSLGSGFTYQWQSNTNNGGWVNVGTETTVYNNYNATAPAGAGTTIEWRLVVTCTNSGLSSTAESDVFTVISCIPGISNSYSPSTNYINQVSFLGTLNDITNNSTYSDNPRGYQDFSGLSDKSMQAQGEGVNVYFQTTDGAFFKAWVDWNRDGDFTDAGELVYDAGGVIQTSTTFGFIIPETALTGDYRIRIRANDYYGNSNFNSCGILNNWGETEDYLFTVTQKCDAKILTVTHGSNCGEGDVEVSATGTAATTDIRWYTSETGGTLIGTSLPGSAFLLEDLTEELILYAAAYSALTECESPYRVEVRAEIQPLPSLDFIPSTDEVCGTTTIIEVTAEGGEETIYLINADFEDNLNGFTVDNLIENGGTVDSQSQWQRRESTFQPTGQSWKPAVSSGINGNYFVMATSDIGAFNYNTALVSPVVNTTDFTNLTLKFKMYFSRYNDDNTGTTGEYVTIEYYNGTSWAAVPGLTIVTDVGQGTKFETRTYDFTPYVNQANFRFRIRYFAGWTDGVAVDNIQLYGNRPMAPSFTWDDSNISVYIDPDATIEYEEGTPASVVYIKPTEEQLELNEDLIVSATAELTNGCSVTGSLEITNNTKVWNPDLAVTNWNSSSWKPAGSVPTAENCVFVRKPVNISAGVDGLAKNLLIDENGSLSIQPSGSLTVTDFIVNEAAASAFVVESDANLLQINPAENTGEITVKRSANVPSNQYNFWASPVAGQNMYAIYDFIPTDRVMTYNTWDDYYTIVPNPAYGQFGIGYSIKGPSIGGPDVTSEFIGIPHNETLSGPNTIPISTQGQGFNLIGNPYPSNLNLKMLYESNTDNLDPSFYFWDNTGNTIMNQQGSGYSGINFAVYNAVSSMETQAASNGGSGKKPNGIVKPGQGFIVQAKAGSGIEVNNAMRTTALKIDPLDEDAPYFKNGLTGEFDSQRPMEGKFWLELVNPNNLHIQIAIGYFEQADHAFDKYDTPVVNESASDNLYSFSSDAEKLTINGRGPFTVEDVIPLGVGFYVQERYRIQLEDTKGIFVNHQNIYLKDKYLNLIHNLSSSPYEFESVAGEFTDRFEIVFKREGFTNPAIENQISIVRQGSNILVSSSLDKIIQVEVFNLAGWQVYKKDSLMSKEILIPATSFDNQIIVVTVLTEKGEKVSQKLVNK